MTTSAETEAGKVGLRISCQKTKVMQVGDQQTNTNLHISGEPVENVRQFTYLGSTMTAEGDTCTDTDISARIIKAALVFRRMNPVWNSGKISRVLKNKLLQDRITNKEVYHRTGTKPLSITITERRMRYVLRMTSDRHAKTSMFWKPEGKKKRKRETQTNMTRYPPKRSGKQGGITEGCRVSRQRQSRVENTCCPTCLAREKLSLTVTNFYDKKMVPVNDVRQHGFFISSLKPEDDMY
ncbi:hypothetical protein Bbelb_074100 [Branchiostoma belcheri]|nr:hypothetical protein Bbelb_074100 [Branchiostoma belcheri]